ncbi:MAG: hypothetical protein ABEJ85_01340 [Haloarculaceae archaeon]
MLPSATTVLQGGLPLTSPGAILAVLVVLALIVLVGRVLMAVAWRLIIIGIIVVGTVYVLGVLGF